MSNVTTKKGIKEPFCGISHLSGAALSLVGWIVLLYLSNGKVTHLFASTVYSLTLICLYLASGLYHSLHVSEAGVKLLQRLDHTGIYLLIAGTYTPVCLITLKGPVGYSILAAEWIMAGFGVYATLVHKRIGAVTRVMLYLFMGWLIVFAMPQIRGALPANAVTWMTAGGIAYTVGTIVFATEKPVIWPGKFDGHDLWHVFVLAGSACHYVLMAVFVIPG